MSPGPCELESVTDGAGPAKKCEVSLDFAELKGASDPVLIGFPQLLQWGVRFEEDADGNPWVELTKLGVTLLAERRGSNAASLAVAPSVSVNLVGPAVLNVPFQVRRGVDLDAWVTDGDNLGCHVVGRKLSDSMVSETEGYVTMYVDPGAEVLIGPSAVPWSVETHSEELAGMVQEGYREGAQLARASAYYGDKPRSWYRSEDGEKVLHVRTHHRCMHNRLSRDDWEKRACGHVWCKVCQGFVDPEGRQALVGPGPIIACNRKPRGFEDYETVFCEVGHPLVGLTASVRRAVAPFRAAPAVDVSPTTSDFLGNKYVYERLKKDIKRRSCYHWHFTVPWVSEFDDLLDLVVNRVVALCHIVHMVGDAFSILSPWPSHGVSLPRTRELGELPGVCAVRVDGCEYGSKVGKSSVIIVTNHVWIPWLGRDWRVIRDHPGLHLPSTSFRPLRLIGLVHNMLHKDT